MNLDLRSFNGHFMGEDFYQENNLFTKINPSRIELYICLKKTNISADCVFSVCIYPEFLFHNLRSAMAEYYINDNY